MENNFTHDGSMNPVMDPELRWKEELRQIVGKLLDAADEKKANDVIAVHVGDKTIIADWFIFMSGTSAIHVKALCDELEDRAAELGLVVRRKEGYHEGRWIVLDFSSVLMHIFHPEEREYYNVERLWIDPTTDILRSKE